MSRYSDMVGKATKSKLTPPKRKHVRNIILETHKDNGASGFYHELFKRPMEKDEIVCWKGLVTVHQVVHEGHPKVLEDSYYRVSFLESIVNSYTHNLKDVATLIVLYANVLIHKFQFHHQFADLPGDFSPDVIKKREKLNASQKLQALEGMQELVQGMWKVQRKILESKVFSDCKVSALIPIILECYNIYTLEVQWIKQLITETEDFDELVARIERFYGQHLILRNFFNEAAVIKYVATIIAVPTLSRDPPQFNIPRKPKKVEAPKQPQPVSTPPPQVTPQLQPTPVTTVATTPEQGHWNPFSGTAKPQDWVTFSSPSPILERRPSYSAPVTPMYTTPVVTHQPQQPIQNKEASKSGDQFGDLWNMLLDSQMKPPSEEEKKRTEQERLKREAKERELLEQERKRAEEEKKRKAEEEARRKEAERKRIEEEEKKRKLEEERKRVEEEKKRIQKEEEEKKKKQQEEQRLREEERLRQEQERVRQIVKEETSNELRALKLRILELETQLDREKEKSGNLSKEISNLQIKLQDYENQLKSESQSSASLREALENKESMISALTLEQGKLKAESASLQQQIQRVTAKYQEENDNLFAKEFAQTQNIVDGYISRLDNPTNLGNDAADARIVMEASNSLAITTEKLFYAINTGNREELFEILNGVSSMSGQLFDDVKGTSRKVADSDARQRLLDAGRSAGSALSNLLAVANNIKGRVKDENERKELGDAVMQSKSKLQELSQEAINAEKASDKPDTDGEDLEDLAEKELLAAAKVIEQAANELLAAQQRQIQMKPKEPDAPDVAGAILDAAMAITKATALLVNAAAVAQKERVEKGRQHEGPMYRKDPTWSQGLISSAKSVASATKTLITTANEAVVGKIEEEAVIAASKAVAASTAHLIAATRAKSDDPNSATQKKLNMASKAIATATAQLVGAAKAAAKPTQEETQMDAPTSDIAKKVKEMELQTQILKLEKELDITRTKLLGMRKNAYSS